MRPSNPIHGTFAAIAALAILATPWMPASAQTSGGSTYSIFNMGDISYGATASAAGRGGVEAAVPTSTVINGINPAAWSDLRLVTLQAAMNFEQYQVSDASGTIYQNNSKLLDFGIAFPYSVGMGGTLAFAVRPYTTVNYRSQTEDQVPILDSTTRTLTTYNGSGGLSEALLGSSFRPVEWLAVGATANLYFGGINQQSDVSFPNVTTLNPANYQTRDLYLGFGGRFGVQAIPMEELRVGAVYELGTELERERYLTTQLIEAGREVPDTLSVTTERVKLPARIIVGAAYTTGRFLFSADASFQAWGKEQFSTARPENRFAFGIDRLASTSMNASGFDRWTFRLGGYYRQTYYEMANGQGIDQMAVSLGTRIPISGISGLNSATALDLGIEVGKRGTTEGGLTQELFGRLAVELIVSELWFLRPTF